MNTKFSRKGLLSIVLVLLMLLSLVPMSALAATVDDGILCYRPFAKERLCDRYSPFSKVANNAFAVLERAWKVRNLFNER